MDLEHGEIKLGRKMSFHFLQVTHQQSCVRPFISAIALKCSPTSLLCLDSWALISCSHPLAQMGCNGVEMLQGIQDTRQNIKLHEGASTFYNNLSFPLLEFRTLTGFIWSDVLQNKNGSRMSSPREKI